MTSPFAPKEVPLATRIELDKRSKSAAYLQSVSPSMVKYRITSMCEACDEAYQVITSTNFGQKQILDSSADSLQSRDQIALDRGRIDNPYLSTNTYTNFGLQEIKVAKQGELGTTRKTTITFTIADLNAFGKIQNCYFIPGMSVRVEWGNKMPTAGFPRDISDQAANKLIQDFIAKEPNYEGIQGRVTNFGYNLTEGRYWTCTLEIISATEGGTPLEPPCKNTDGTLGSKCTREDKAKPPPEGDPPPTKKVSPLLSYLIDLATYSGINNGSGQVIADAQVKARFGSAIDTPSIPGTIPTGPIQRHQYTGDSRDPETSDISTITSFFTNFFGAGTTETYITWGAFERILNYYCNGFDKKISELEKCYDSSGVELRANPNVNSSDPRICIIPGSSFARKLLDDDGRSLDSSETAIRIIKNNYSVAISNILVNVIMLVQTLTAIEDTNQKAAVGTEQLTTENFIQQVIDRINNACGNLWEPILIPSPSHTKANKILTKSCTDIKGDPQGQQPIVYSIYGGNLSVGSSGERKKQAKHILGKDDNFNNKESVIDKTESTDGNNVSILIDASFSMKMTSAMKTQALYAGKYNGGDTSTDPNNQCQATALKSFRIPSAGSSAAFVNMAVKPIDYPPCAPCKAPEEIEKTFLQKVDELNSNGISDNSTQQVRDGLVKLYQTQILESEMISSGIALKKAPRFNPTVSNLTNFTLFGEDATSKKSEKNTQCDGQPLPFELTLTIDGVGGLGWGQLITSTVIPETIRNSYNWQITTVEHEVTNIGWRTQIRTIPKYKSS